jgi:hypothetical protein
MLWPIARSAKRSSSQPRFFKPQLMRLEEREVLDASPIGWTTLQSYLPALTSTILSFENSIQSALAGFTTQLNSLNQELSHLQSENNYLLQTIQQLEHQLLTFQPPSTPPAPPSLASFAGVYRGVQVPTSLQGDIPSSTSQRVYLTVNGDGSGQILVAPFDGTNLTLSFNAGSITYTNGTIGFTYPSGLTSYIQFSFTPGSGQLTGNLVAHGNWGQGGSFVAFSFPNITLTKVA